MFGSEQFSLKRIIIVSTIISTIIVFVYGFMNLIKYHEVDLLDMAYGLLYSFLATFSIYSLNKILFHKLTIKYPWNKNAVKRLLIEFILTSLMSTMVILIFFFVFLTIFPNYVVENPDQKKFESILIALIANTIVMGFNEGEFIFKEWKKSLISEEHMKRKNIEIQYQALINQVNPHFLFNSLNALASLIRNDQGKAIEFTLKFSEIYRYVLDVKNKILVELNEELMFLNSYMYLQKIRYGENLMLTISVDSKYLSMFLPPLSLQLVAENSIKHNIISDESPLLITIDADGNFLKVVNNYKPRQNDVFSTKTGQKNIKERYFELTDEIPEFYLENDHYIAKLPLLQDE